MTRARRSLTNRKSAVRQSQTSVGGEPDREANVRRGMREEVGYLKRRRILEEARRLFFSQGYRGTTMEAIADAVDMGKPFLYRHFRNKLELLVELYDEAIALSEEALEDALSKGANARDIVRIFVRNYLNVVLHEREIVAVFFRENVNVPPEELRRIDEHKRVFDRRLRAVIQRGIDTGEFSVDDARLASYAIVGMVNWSYQWYRERGRLNVAEIGEVFADYALRILTAPPLPTVAPGRA